MVLVEAAEVEIYDFQWHQLKNHYDVIADDHLGI